MPCPIYGSLRRLHHRSLNRGLLPYVCLKYIHLVTCPPHFSTRLQGHLCPGPGRLTGAHIPIVHLTAVAPTGILRRLPLTHTNMHIQHVPPHSPPWGARVGTLALQPLPRSLLCPCGWAPPLVGQQRGCRPRREQRPGGRAGGRGLSPRSHPPWRCSSVSAPRPPHRAALIAE